MRQFNKCDAIVNVTKMIDLYEKLDNPANNGFLQSLKDKKERLVKDLDLLKNVKEFDEIIGLTACHYYMNVDKTQFVTSENRKAVLIGLGLIKFNIYLTECDGELYFADIYPMYKDAVIAQIGGVKGDAKKEYFPVNKDDLLQVLADNILNQDYEIIINK